MSDVVIRINDLQFKSGDLATKAPAEILTVVFDYTQGLADGVVIADSAFTITPVSPHVDTELEQADADTFGASMTRVSVAAGLLGSAYDLVSTIETSESPAQTLTSALRVLIE